MQAPDPITVPPPRQRVVPVLRALGGTLATLLLAWGLSLGLRLWRGGEPTAPLPPALAELIQTAPAARTAAGAVEGILVWAIECPLCRLELPWHRGALAQGALASVMLPTGSADRARDWLAAHDLHPRLGLYDDQGTLTRALGVRVVPTLIVLDRCGQPRWRLTGVTLPFEPTLLHHLARLRTGTCGPTPAPRP